MPNEENANTRRDCRSIFRSILLLQAETGGLFRQSTRSSSPNGHLRARNRRRFWDETPKGLSIVRKSGYRSVGIQTSIFIATKAKDILDSRWPIYRFWCRSLHEG